LSSRRSRGGDLLQAQINVADLVRCSLRSSDDDWRAALGHWHRAIDRTMRFNVLAMSGKAVEAAAMSRR